MSACPNALTVTIFGGTAETIAMAPKKANHESLYFWYVAISSTIYYFMRETSKNSAIEAEADADAEVAVR
ncbi:hypothetical protein ACQPZ2_40210 [Nocardia pseudovaccinii]|uniref:hypothetical protein n=1 Tax=Nocardia pseudovaccinii TaxID=189540 RepID=UPI003D910846